MGCMVASLMVSTSRIDRTRSEMAGYWTLRIREMIDIGTILFLVLIGIMIVIVIILIGGVIGDEFKKEKQPTFSWRDEETTRCKSMFAWYEEIIPIT